MDYYVHAPSVVDLNLPNLKYIYVPEHSHYDIRIFSFGKENCNKDKKLTGPEQIKFYSLHFIIDGKGKFNIEDKSYELEKNTFFLLPPNVTLSYQQDKSCPWSYYWISFDGVNAKALAERCFKDNFIMQIDDEKSYKIKSEFEELLNDNTYPGKSNKDLSALSAFYRIFSIISDVPQKHSTVSESNKLDENHIIKALQIINERYSDINLSTSMISGILNLHPNYFSSIFKKYMNVPFTKYLTAFRLNIARQLLKYSSNPINEIAINVGFSDPLYFSRVFKSYYNISPKNYRFSKSSHL